MAFLAPHVEGIAVSVFVLKFSGLRMCQCKNDKYLVWYQHKYSIKIKERKEKWKDSVSQMECREVEVRG